MKLNNKHFYSTSDFSRPELLSLVELALALKSDKQKGMGKILMGKTLSMLFFNPSLRTRISFSVAMQRLGGMAIDVPIKHGYQLEFKEGTVMDGSNAEHVKEAAEVLSRYCSAIAVRSSDLVTGGENNNSSSSWREAKKDIVLRSFMKYSTVPVINMESNLYHPCQGLADMVTLVEKLGKHLKSKRYTLTWAYHPKPLPVATVHSQILAAIDLGMKVVISHPEGWELDQEIVEIMEERAHKAGGSLSFTNSMEEGFKETHVVCAKSWGAVSYYGKWQKEKKARERLKHWIVNSEKMQLSNDAYFMHCLPVRRNVVVTDEVLDGANSLVYEQAENRLWAQMAVLLGLLHC